MVQSFLKTDTDPQFALKQQLGEDTLAERVTTLEAEKTELQNKVAALQEQIAELQGGE